MIVGHLRGGGIVMRRSSIIAVREPANRSSSSDCQLTFSSQTAETANLSAIMRNNTIYCDLAETEGSDPSGIPEEEKAEN